MDQVSVENSRGNQTDRDEICCYLPSYKHQERCLDGSDTMRSRAVLAWCTCRPEKPRMFIWRLHIRRKGPLHSYGRLLYPSLLQYIISQEMRSAEVGQMRCACASFLRHDAHLKRSQKKPRNDRAMCCPTLRRRVSIRPSALDFPPKF